MWGRLFEAVSKAYEGDMQMVDSSSIRVHQHAANGKKGVRKTPPGGACLQGSGDAKHRWKAGGGTMLTADAWGARAAG